MEGKELRAIFGKNIRCCRGRRNWSLADLAERANISINFLGDIERGNKWPHPDTLARLAGALEVRAFELFLEEDAQVDVKTEALMGRFARDVSLALNKSLSLSVSQSVERVRRQYGLADGA